MTDAEKLEWACWVLDQHHHRGQTWLAVMRCGMPWAVSGGDDVLYPDEAIAVALWLEERARSKLSEKEQAEWAAETLSKHKLLATRWSQIGYPDTGSWSVEAQNGLVLSLGCAIATAERFIRREMLGDTSDASPNEVKS